MCDVLSSDTPGGACQVTYGRDYTCTNGRSIPDLLTVLEFECNIETLRKGTHETAADSICSPLNTGIMHISCDDDQRSGDD